MKEFAKAIEKTSTKNKNRNNNNSKKKENIVIVVWNFKNLLIFNAILALQEAIPFKDENLLFILF
jgi:hypothetical protein